jgi:hypothetical protein
MPHSVGRGLYGFKIEGSPPSAASGVSMVARDGLAVGRLRGQASLLQGHREIRSIGLAVRAPSPASRLLQGYACGPESQVGWQAASLLAAVRAEPQVAVTAGMVMYSIKHPIDREATGLRCVR